MHADITREQAMDLLKKYNQDEFHMVHALTVEGVMRWYARELGYGEDEEFWGLVGLLHDVDFEKYPDEHCIKAPELLKEIGSSDELIHAVCSHGYGITVDVKPEHEMEKILFAADELTGLIGAAAKMRPSKSVISKSLSSSHPSWSAPCRIISLEQPAAKRLSLNFFLRLETSISMTLLEGRILAMRSCEDEINKI